MPQLPIKIVVADDHQFILDSLEILFSKMPDYEVVAFCKNGKEVIEALTNFEGVEIVLADIDMPQMNGLEMAKNIMANFLNVKILLLTVSEDVETIRRALQAGVAGYVMKKAGKKELHRALETVLSGEKYYSESVIFELLNGNQKVSEVVENVEVMFNILTEREIEIIRLIAKEYSTTEIAEKLFISVGTVEKHRHNIFKKLNIKNVVGLMQYAFQHKII